MLLLCIAGLCPSGADARVRAEVLRCSMSTNCFSLCNTEPGSPPGADLVSFLIARGVCAIQGMPSCRSINEPVYASWDSFDALGGGTRKHPDSLSNVGKYWTKTGAQGSHHAYVPFL